MTDPRETRTRCPRSLVISIMGMASLVSSAFRAGKWHQLLRPGGELQLGLGLRRGFHRSHRSISNAHPNYSRRWHVNRNYFTRNSAVIEGIPYNADDAASWGRWCRTIAPTCPENNSERRATAFARIIVRSIRTVYEVSKAPSRRQKCAPQLTRKPFAALVTRKITNVGCPQIARIKVFINEICKLVDLVIGEIPRRLNRFLICLQYGRLLRHLRRPE